MSAAAKDADLRETREITLATIRYYQNVQGSFSRLIAEIQVKQDKLDAEKAKLLGDYNEAPAKIDACEKALARLERQEKLAKVSPKLDRLTHLRKQLEELIGQNIDAIDVETLGKMMRGEVPLV